MLFIVLLGIPGARLMAHVQVLWRLSLILNITIVINPRRACAARVTVIGWSFCVCLSVCPHTLFWQYAQLKV